MTALKNILVGTDFSECGDDALKFAFTLAAAFDAKVHLLHCFTLRDMLAASSPDHEQLADADAWAERKLADVAAPYRAAGLVGELIVAMGKTGPALLETSARLAADLVMLGSRPRAGLAHHLFLDVAERVLHEASCPVMVLRHPVRRSQPAWQGAFQTALTQLRRGSQPAPANDQDPRAVEEDDIRARAAEELLPRGALRER